MKLGNIEGSPQEIKDFIDIHDLKLDDYLQRPPSSLNIFWILLPSLLIFINAVAFAWKPHSFIKTVIWIAISIWLTISVYLKFRSTTVSIILGIGLLILLLYCAGVVNLQEAAQWLEHLQPRI